MASKPSINMSLVLIIASMALLASSNPIQPVPEMSYDFPTCLEAVKGCFYEIYQFKMSLVSGEQPGSGLIGPACCAAIMDIHDKCWLFMLPDPFFTPQLQSYCNSQIAPTPGGPSDPDSPLAPDSPSDPETPTPAPQVDPPATPAPQAPSPTPQLDPPAAPASQVDPPAPAVDPPAPQVDPPAPTPLRRRCHRHHGGGLDEKWDCASPASPAPAPPRRHCHRHRGHGGSLDEKWYCT